MKDIRLLTKLLGGFIIVALIVLAVGFVGLLGARGLNAEIRNIGRNRLAGVKNLLQVAEAQAQVNVAENTLLQRSLDAGSAQDIFKEFDARKKVIDDSLAVFESLSKSKDELNLWSQFKPAADAWWKVNQDFIGLAQAYWSSPSDEAFTAMQSQMAQNGREFGVANSLLHDLVRINDQEANLAVQEGSAMGARVEAASMAGMGVGIV
ncbi:MAG: MCP four helix bundle domain-containing protein [Spirochaetia bacterium]